MKIAQRMQGLRSCMHTVGMDVGDAGAAVVHAYGGDGCGQSGTVKDTGVTVPEIDGGEGLPHPALAGLTGGG